MWGTILYSGTLSGWITCGVQYFIVVYHQGGLHIVVHCQGGLHVGYNTLLWYTVRVDYMWDTILYSDTMSGWITCGVQYSIVVHCQGGLHVGYNTL